MRSTKGLDYAKIKKSAIDLEPYQEKVLLSQVEIDTNGQLSLKGVPVRVADKVVEKQLINSILGLSPAFAKKLENVSGTELKKNLVEILKMGLSLSKKGSEITVIGDPSSQCITHILPGKKDFISNSFALQMFESTMNMKGNNFTLVGFDRTGDGGFQLNVRTGDVVTPETKKGKMVGEEFNPGYTLTNNPLKGLTCTGYVERLVCSNGMTSRDEKGGFSISSLADGKIRKFFEEFVVMGKSNFIPAFFPEQLEKAMHTAASFKEIKDARNMMLRHSKLKTDDELYSYLPEFKSVVNQLARKGVDYAKCSDIQLQNFPSTHKVWDIVNRMTWFGSHEVGAEVIQSAIQNKAGELFQKKTFDTENVLVFDK